MLLKLFALARGLAYAAAFVALWWWVVVSARQLDPRLGLTLPRWVPIPGSGLVVAGAAVTLSCVLAFALAGKGTPAPFDAPREFVAAGPYHFVRNPMYLGAAAVIVGAGLMLRSPAATAVALLFLALTHAFVLLYEEPTLERRFGESYRRYKLRVRRWLPWVPRAASGDRGSGSAGVELTSDDPELAAQREVAEEVMREDRDVSRKLAE